MMKEAIESIEPQIFPKIRFNEFGEDWTNKKLSDILALVTRPIKMGDEHVYSLVTVKRRYGGIVHRGDYKGKNVKVKSQFLLEENDFLISKRQISHNACGLVPKQLAGSIVSNEYSVFIPKENLDISYFNFFCHLPKVSRTFFLSSTGVHIEKMIFKVDDWFKWQFAFPSLPEQQKIASFLSAVDEKIQQLSCKKELLEQYKKGVMQQLFSGKLRFKDKNGKDYADWEEKRLGEVATKKSSNISANKIEENFGDFIIYGASGILKKVDFYKEENDYVSIVKDGAGVGRLLYCKGKSSVLGTMEIITPKRCINTYFLFCLLSNIDFTKYITGSTIPHIYFKDYSIEHCGIPSLSEQKKIADFLSSIDNKIESTNQQINQTQSFKKGLLQQMFV